MNKMVLLARLFAVLLFLFALFALKTSAAPQRDGDIDSSFAGGEVRADFALAEGGAGTASVLQPDGKLLVAGATLNNLPVDADDYIYHAFPVQLHNVGLPNMFAVARYDPDGSLDAGFGVGGTSRISVPGNGSVAKALVLQTDGKIVLAGNIGRSAALVRLNANGTLDNSFDSDGIITIDTEADTQVFNAVTLQPDGRIVAVGRRMGGKCVSAGFGSASTLWYEDIIVARFNPAGSVDPEFGVDGVKVVHHPSEYDALGLNLSAANAVTIASDGAIVVAGYLTNSTCDFFGLIDFQRTDENFLAARLYNDQLDTSFGVNGFALTALEGQSTAANALVLQDDKIVLGGSYAGDFTMLRYNHNGSLDTSFGMTGTITTDFNGGDDFVTSLALQADGKIVATGPATVSNLDFGVARYSVDGILDNSFGLHGKTVADFGGTSDWPGAVALNNATDSMFVAGSADRRFAVTQLGSDGRPNLKFGAYGQVTTRFLSTDSVDTSHALVRQPDGKIVVVGTARGVSTLDFALARYNADGTLDSTFGVGGKTTSDFDGDDIAYAVALVNDRFFVGGVIGGNFAIARYNSDGTLDSGFGYPSPPDYNSHGYVVTRFAETGAEALYSLAVLPNAILAYGSAANGSMALARYNLDGTLDTSFGVGGKFIGNFPAGRGMVLQPDGKILLTLGGSLGMGVVRLLPDGSLDQSFGDDGRAYKQLTEYYTSATFTVAVQPGGKIVVGGFKIVAYSCLAAVPNRPDPPCSRYYGNYVLLRFTAEGRWDEGFGNDGRNEDGGFLHSFGIRSMLVQPDGRIVVAAAHDNKFVVDRYKRDGNLDDSFGNGGRIELWDGNGDNWPDLAQQPDGKLLFTGPDLGAGNAGDFRLARIENRPSFSDVSAADYYYEPLLALAERGVLSGYADGSFRPYNNTTRAQLAKIVVIANDLPLVTPDSATFTDVPTDDPFFRLVETAVARGIISGYSIPGSLDREFRPSADVTRAQMCKIVVGAAGWTLIEPANATFSDVPRDDPFYHYVETAVAHGIISGYQSAGVLEFRPGNPATRGQIAKIVYLSATSDVAQK